MISLPSFLPFPEDQLCQIYSANHDSLVAMLDLCLVYLKTMHPWKPAQPDKPMWASAHLLKLFINDPLIKLLLLKSSPTTITPSKELNALQICLSSLENTLTKLAFDELEGVPECT